MCASLWSLRGSLGAALREHLGAFWLCNSMSEGSNVVKIRVLEGISILQSKHQKEARFGHTGLALRLTQRSGDEYFLTFPAVCLSWSRTTRRQNAFASTPRQASLDAINCKDVVPLLGLIRWRRTCYEQRLQRARARCRSKH